ncbi:MAG: hypothetical protein DRO90_02000 [Candidatus Altiarchaeales archaeon]|nr:MAG: hypothetical protein DRO95_02425 [Candidatus Altiarchaeales archaeon]RLI94388.1 MAG: hypothetical protein DRO94_02990 [Candidatus Altiarchaeales archaeon]RLI94465.1 MAG: hypothetical protein DRO90_02000 [Candidatus Altiarchaeales archaeon]HDO82022.1 hypothetical protein [Candidatus Altiarchaeales archaeon]HEX54671.1 hypothetical protein [Candidatus Altiarchaeales archaeon]
MRPKEKKILDILLNDLQRLEDIHACGVVRRGLEGIFPSTEEFAREIMPIWDTMKATMEKLFEIIEQYSDEGLDKIYFELRDYDVMFFILPRTDTALVAIVPALANRGLLEVEMENARRRIIEIIESGNES